MSGIAGHTNHYKTGVRVGNWVEETFGAELSKREFKVDPEMYSSESRAKLDRTAKIVAKEGVKTELLVPPQAALQNINLFRESKKDDRFVTSNDAHFQPKGGASKIEGSLEHKTRKARSVEQSNRFKTMRSTSDAQVRKAMAKIERSGKAKDGALRYNAKDVKAFMEKKTSLW